MKEYGIYIQNGSGRPYMVNPYDNIESAKIALQNMLAYHNKIKQPYFVDNDFFENKNPLFSHSKYYCIKYREVTEWVVYSQKEDRKEDDHSNILFFSNYFH